MSILNRLKNLEAIAAARKSRAQPECELSPEQARGELKTLLDQLIATEEQRQADLKAIMSPAEFEVHEAQRKEASDRERERILAVEVDEKYLSPYADLSGFPEQMQRDITMKFLYSVKPKECQTC